MWIDDKKDSRLPPSSFCFAMSRLSESEIAHLRATADLKYYVGQKVELKREGKEWKGLCPFHKETTPSFFVVPHKQMFHCFGCAAHGDIFEWFKRSENLDFRGAVSRILGAPPPPGMRTITPEKAARETQRQADDVRRKIEKARRLWNESNPAQGTIVETYLNKRGLSGIIIPPTIRFHAQLWNAETDTLMPGMVAVITDRNQRIVGIHRTFLDLQGNKAKVKNAKKMLGACMGAHVCLGLPSEGKLAVAEGIETGLSVMKAKPALAVWAALSLGNMNAPIPGSITELILCTDGDNKDPRAADALIEKAVREHRAANAKRIVRIAPADNGKDFNDMIRGASSSIHIEQRLALT